MRDKPEGSEPDEIIQEVTLPDIEGVVEKNCWVDKWYKDWG